MRNSFALPSDAADSRIHAVEMVPVADHDVIEHERLISLEMPVGFTLDARSVVQLSGTNSAFDYRYYMDSI